MKSFFVQIKKLWKNPRSHAFMEIGFYLFFFLILLLLLNTESSKKVVTVEAQYQNLVDYAYEMIVTKDFESYHIVGRKGQTQEQIVVEELGITYDIINGNVIDEKENILFQNWDLFSPRQLSVFIQNGEVNAITNYKDGNKRIEYEMDCKLWNPLQQGICKLQTIQTETQIVQVELQVENLYTIRITYKREDSSG